MIFNLIRRELRGKYQRSLLGFFWTMLNPLCQITVYTIIFTYIFRSAIEEYHLYLMSGLMPWIFFNESMVEGAGTIIVNGDLTRKIYFPRDVLVIAKVSSKFVNFALSLVIVFMFYAFSDRGIGLQYLVLLPVVMLTEYLLCLGFALFFSAITVYMRDMRYIVGVIMMAWVWATPIMYEFSTISNEAVKKVISLNPMTRIVEAYHQILYHHRYPQLSSLLIAFITATLILLIGETIFIKLESGFAEEV